MVRPEPMEDPEIYPDDAEPGAYDEAEEDADDDLDMEDGAEGDDPEGDAAEEVPETSDTAVNEEDAPPVRKTIQKVYARRELSMDDLGRISGELADIVVAIQQLEDEKKETASSFKTRIDAAKERMQDLARERREGFAMREHLCELRLNYETSRREWFDVHSGELVREDPFTPEDYQRDMFESLAENARREAEASEHEDAELTETSEPAETIVSGGDGVVGSSYMRLVSPGGEPVDGVIAPVFGADDKELQPSVVADLVRRYHVATGWMDSIGRKSKVTDEFTEARMSELVDIETTATLILGEYGSNPQLELIVTDCQAARKTLAKSRKERMPLQ